jgi:Protein tyrosine and serine/threonine kinase
VKCVVESLAPDFVGVNVGRHLISRKNLEIGEILGAGAFGIVRRANLVEEERVVAVKEMKMKEITSKDLEDWVYEMGFMIRLDHSNVLQLVGICAEERPPWLVLDFMSGGSLSSQLFDSLGLVSLVEELWKKVNGLALEHHPSKKPRPDLGSDSFCGKEISKLKRVPFFLFFFIFRPCSLSLSLSLSLFVFPHQPSSTLINQPSSLGHFSFSCVVGWCVSY